MTAARMASLAIDSAVIALLLSWSLLIYVGLETDALGESGALQV